jgi:hypothetical protein
MARDAAYAAYSPQYEGLAFVNGAARFSTGVPVPRSSTAYAICTPSLVTQ